MVRSWKDQFQDREVSPVKLNQSWLDLGKIENKSKPADGQTDRQYNRVRYTCSTKEHKNIQQLLAVLSQGWVWLL